MSLNVQKTLGEIMKLFALAILFAPLLGFAQSYSADCSAIGDSSLDAGGGDLISHIKSLKISDMTQDGNFRAQLTVQGVIGIDVLNGDTSEKQHVELYTVKERKDGMMFELQGDKKNSYQFNIVVLELGVVKANSAGPIPAGTFDQVVSLGVIDSNQYYKNDSPMTVKKIVFACKTTYAY